MPVLSFYCKVLRVNPETIQFLEMHVSVNAYWKLFSVV